MSIYHTVLVLLLIVVGLSCKTDPIDDPEQFQLPSCNELTLVAIEKGHFDTGDKLTAKVKNDCKGCKQNVYTGLMFFAGKDTLAIDTAYTGELTPLNGEVRAYRLKALKAFSSVELTRVQMLGACDSLKWDLD